MLTYQQKRIFLIVVMVAMLAPMILLGLGRHIQQKIYVKNCYNGTGSSARIYGEECYNWYDSFVEYEHQKEYER